MKRRLVLTLIAGFCISANSGAIAQGFPETPPNVILSNGNACKPQVEVCGDGIDDDCDGKDLLCDGADPDRDGYLANNDCNDSDRNIFPGVGRSCSATCGSGVQTCQQDGRWSPCSCSPICESKGSGRCYYISALTGDDSNPGSFDKPWRSQLKIVSYYSSEFAPPGAVSLKAGDVVYFHTGVYKDEYMYNGTRNVISFRGVHGTSAAPVVLKAYPGANVVISASNKVSAGISLLQCSHFRISGVLIDAIYGGGIRLGEVSNAKITNVTVRNIDGVDNDNIAGITLQGSDNVEIANSIIHDNYDRTCADTNGEKTANSRNIVLFSGGNHRIHHNVIFQSQPITAQRTGACIAYKHSATIPNSVFEVDHNILRNCAWASVGSGTFNSRVHHNLILNSASVTFNDHAGRTIQDGNVVEFNTLIDNDVSFNYIPTSEYAPIGTMTFRKNIVIDTRSSHSAEKAMVTIGNYSSDELYRETVQPTKLRFDLNCFFSPNTPPKWNLFGRNGAQFGELGSILSFSGWQGMGFDLGSFNINPQMSAAFRPLDSRCADKGWTAN